MVGAWIGSDAGVLAGVAGAACVASHDAQAPRREAIVAWWSARAWCRLATRSWWRWSRPAR